MKVAVFSTKTYDRTYLKRFNTGERHQFVFHDAQLNTNTAGYLMYFYETQSHIYDFATNVFLNENPVLVSPNGINSGDPML
jgi:CMP-N-acetylneuraminic acid synthetase